MKDNYQLLIEKLDRFIRKYYLNQIIKGAIYVLGISVLLFLLVAAFEYFGEYSTAVRTGLFYSYLLVNIAILVKYVAIPAAHWMHLGKVLSHDQAAAIVGKHFAEVKDKLLNTLQLKHQAETLHDPSQQSLINASIAQRTRELQPVPFTNAIDLRGNTRYLKYALIPVVALLAILITSRNMLLESTTRLINHQTYYEPVAPFEFVLANDSMQALRQENFTVKLRLKGKEIPNQSYIVLNGNQFRMTRVDKMNFEFVLKNLQEDQEFQFGADGFISRPYQLKVLPKPLLQGFTLSLDYPDYVGKKDEQLKNVGDLNIPAGTSVRWEFNTAFTNNLSLIFSDTALATKRTGENEFRFDKRFLRNDQYFVKADNEYLQSSDSILYHVNVIPDAYPAINVQQEQDSLSNRQLFFSGEISDDYGLTALRFYYRIFREGDKDSEPELQSRDISFSANKTIQAFHHFWDLNEFAIKAGDEIEYFFQVWDNDQVNGRKSSRSTMMRYQAPTKKELEQKMDETNQEIKDKMQAAVRQVTQLQKEMQDAREKLINKKNLNWEDKKMLEDIMKKQEEMQKTMEDLQEQYKENTKEQSDYREMDEDLMQKHQQLQEMFDQVMTDEMKELFRKMEELMDKNMKDQIQQELEKMNLQDKDMEKELDRMLELFKELELDQKMQDAIDKLEELAEKQEKLAEETEKAGNEKDDEKTEELQKEQEQLKEEFEDLQEDLKEMKEMNEELERPRDMDDTEQQEDEIKQEMQEGSEKMEKKQNSKASENQKNAAQKMKKMKEQMESSQSSMEMEGMQEDYESLRQILENLINLSMEQEGLMEELGQIRRYNPQFVELSKKQSKLKDDARLIEDSLLSLSKRVFQIQTFVNKEIGLVNYNMDKTLAALSERQIPSARNHQQYVMTSANNLAVMLSEVMDQMQQQMASMMEGSQQCQNPKNMGEGGKPKKAGGPSMSKMKQLQEQLNQQLQEMKDGKTPGGQRGMSEQLARMAAMQEAIRNEIRKMNEKKGKDGKPGSELQELQKMMEETEKDLVNKRLSNEMLNRQKDIMVKLLDAEKAERQQEFEEKRESKTADQIAQTQQRALEEYKQRKLREVELLQTVPPALNGYYRLKVREYFQEIK
ncbi:MAG: DUF4175 family protein [Bacteroidia bacterium]